MSSLTYGGNWQIGKSGVKKISDELGKKLGGEKSRDFWRKVIKGDILQNIGSNKRSYDGLRKEIKARGATEFVMKSLDKIRQESESNQLKKKLHYTNMAKDESGISQTNNQRVGYSIFTGNMKTKEINDKQNRAGFAGGGLGKAGFAGGKSGPSKSGPPSSTSRPVPSANFTLH